MSNLLPNEGLTEFFADSQLNTASVQAFMETLDTTQKKRFKELAHHLIAIGFDEGQNRRIVGDPTPEQEASVGMLKFAYYLRGIAEANE